jgi:integrase/recombinase XerD
MTTTALAIPAGDLESAIVEVVDALPLPRDPSSARWTIHSATAAWLRSRRSTHTRRAYLRDLNDYLLWCEQFGVDVRAAVRADVDAYVAALQVVGKLSQVSMSRRLSAISSWYGYLMSNGVLTTNPVAAVDRPILDRDNSTTVGLTPAELGRFVQTARGSSGPQRLRNAALLGCLAELGVRVGEVIALDVESLRTNRGHRTIKVIGKGVKTRELPMPPPLAHDVDDYLGYRAGIEQKTVDRLTGPLFCTLTGKRLDEPAVFRLVRRIAEQAGLPAAAILSPHGLRHSVATAALDAGAELRDVQDLLGHMDPRTTRRYDRARGSLDRSPVYLLAGLFARKED